MFALKVTVCSTIILTSLFANASFLADRRNDLRPGRTNIHGNERSQRVDKITTGRLVHGGNGCPQGTMRISFAPDNLSFSILFDQFIAEIKEGDHRPRDLMRCDAIVPIEIPQGMQMEITSVDFRGFVALPANSRADLLSVFNFRGRGGDGDRMNLKYSFAGPLMDDYEVSSDALNANGQTPDTELSPCGGNTELRIQSQLRIITQSRGQAASVTLDSIDGAAHSIYYVNWRKCEPRRGNRGQQGQHTDRRDRRRPSH